MANGARVAEPIVALEPAASVEPVVAVEPVDDVSESIDAAIGSSINRPAAASSGVGVDGAETGWVG